MALKSSRWPQIPRRKSIQAIANASKVQYVIDRMNKLVSYRCQLFALKPSLTSSSHQLIFQYYIYNVKLLAIIWTPNVLRLKNASLIAKCSASVLFERYSFTQYFSSLDYLIINLILVKFHFNTPEN